ncbi:hypothetical protein [Halorubrum laminariae]|uniref:Uncharacterized protein n=1 Tax=Halorubrum laminariae TaxID=1433523 RepID=A0ABD6BYZ0_9EURY|nr:hypothetical protein [Halorubrum laminariae]
MTDELSRFTSDRRTRGDALWVTEQDWNAGVTENVDVVGDGLVGRDPVQRSGDFGNVVDDFETGSLSAYRGDTGAFSVQSSVVYRGDYAAEITRTGGSAGGITSVSGLENYPKKGSEFSVKLRWDNGRRVHPMFRFGLRDGYNYYGFGLDAHESESGDTEAILQKLVDGTGTVMDSTRDLDELELYDGVWTEIRGVWRDDDTIAVKWLDDAGNELVSLQAVDSDHEGNSGIGIWSNHSGVSGSCTTWWDEILTS